MFICVCGIGPYRWNFEQMFFLWASFHLGDLSTATPAASLFALAPSAYAFFIATSVLVPLVGIFSPSMLGTWLGGFRSAMFHFAGNERHAGYLIRREMLDSAYVLGRRSLHKRPFCTCSPLIPLQIRSLGEMLSPMTDVICCSPTTEQGYFAIAIVLYNSGTTRK